MCVPGVGPTAVGVGSADGDATAKVESEDAADVAEAATTTDRLIRTAAAAMPMAA